MVKKAKKPQKGYALCIGVDISPSSIALCAKSFDPVTRKVYGPVWNTVRWNKEDHAQWDKLKQLADAYHFITDLQNLLGAGGIVRDINQIHVGVEEPPARVMNARAYREQCELEGCFVGALLKWGYHNVYSVNVRSWQKTVREEIGISQKELDKFRVAEWVKDKYGKSWRPLIYNSTKGLIPKPKTSKAKPKQPDDRVDSTGIMEFVWEKVHAHT